MKTIEQLFERATHFEAQGKYADAEPYYIHALQLKERALGSGHPELAADLYNVGLLYFAQDKYHESKQYFARTLALEENLYGPASPRMLCTLQYLAETYFNLHEYETAERLYKRYLYLHKRTRSQFGAELLNNLRNLAEICDLQGKKSEANELRLKAHAISDAELCFAWQQRAS